MINSFDAFEKLLSSFMILFSKQKKIDFFVLQLLTETEITCEI